MAKILWDQDGERLYETGLDRGVLYQTDGSGVAWNGLMSLEENPKNSGNPIFFDGALLLTTPALGDFAATLAAVTYPPEFEIFDGVSSSDAIPGLLLTTQGNRSFGLSYRTLVGSDTEGLDLGYQIHILYNLMAIPETFNYVTVGDTSDPIQFQWKITSRPELIDGFRPTAHLIADSRFLDPDKMAFLERVLYGSEEDDARLPSLETLVAMVVDFHLIVITLHSDGSWTAEGPDDLVYMTSGTEFQIDAIDVTSPDADTRVFEST